MAFRAAEVVSAAQESHRIGVLVWLVFSSPLKNRPLIHREAKWLAPDVLRRAVLRRGRGMGLGSSSGRFLLGSAVRKTRFLKVGVGPGKPFCVRGPRCAFSRSPFRRLFVALKPPVCHLPSPQARKNQKGLSDRYDTTDETAVATVA